MVMPIQTAGALYSIRGGRARGKTTSGKNYWWNDVMFRQQMYGRARKMLLDTAQEAAQYASNQMQDLGGAHAPPGQFPAIQSGNLQDAIDAELFYENRRWIVARFGVYGDVAGRTQADFSNEYEDTTPVGVYAYTLATGVGREGKQWPWVQKTIDHVAEEGWVDAEMVGASMGGTSRTVREITTLTL